MIHKIDLFIKTARKSFYDEFNKSLVKTDLKGFCKLINKFHGNAREVLEWNDIKEVHKNDNFFIFFGVEMN